MREKNNECQSAKRGLENGSGNKINRLVVECHECHETPWHSIDKSLISLPEPKCHGTHPYGVTASVALGVTARGAKWVN